MQHYGITVKRMDNIDILKAICAFLIVCIHVHFPGTIGAYFMTLTRISVPIFFMITGYFYSGIIKKQYQSKQLKKIFKLFIVANGIYILWEVLRAYIRSDIRTFIHTFSPQKIIDFLIFNESPWGGAPLVSWINFVCADYCGCY